jgi:hypothetical protein
MVNISIEIELKLVFQPIIDQEIGKPVMMVVILHFSHRVNSVV